MKPAEVRRGLKYENALGQQVTVEEVFRERARVHITDGQHRPVKVVKPVALVAAEYNQSRRLPTGTTQVSRTVTRIVDEFGAAAFALTLNGRTAAMAKVHADGHVTYSSAAVFEDMPSGEFGEYLDALREIRSLSVAYGIRLQDAQP